jgi:hypothetical protein
VAVVGFCTYLNPQSNIEMADKNKPKGEETQDDNNIEKLAAMLREQMELVQAQRKIQREEVGELQRAVRKLGGEIEYLNS